MSKLIHREITELKERVAVLEEAVKQKTEEARRGPGRPRKTDGND